MEEKLTISEFNGGNKVFLPPDIIETSSIKNKLSGYVTGNDLNNLLSGIGIITEVLNAAPWEYDGNRNPVWSANTEFIKEISGIWTTSGDVSTTIQKEFTDFINTNKFLTYKALHNYYDICEVNHLFSRLSGSITINEQNLQEHENIGRIHCEPDGLTLCQLNEDPSKMFVNIHGIDAVVKPSINNSFTLTTDTPLHLTWNNLNATLPQLPEGSVTGAISRGAVNAVCFAKFQDAATTSITTGLITSITYNKENSNYTLTAIPVVTGYNTDTITFKNSSINLTLGIPSGISTLTPVSGFTDPTGYLQCGSYKISGLTLEEFQNISYMTSGFRNHINFVNQFITTQFVANKNGDLKHLDTVEINTNQAQSGLWSDHLGILPGLTLKFNENQFTIDEAKGLTLYRSDISAPKEHEHPMADITDWDIISARLYDHFSPIVHTHVLNDITNWDAVSGANLSKLYSEFYNHIKDMILHRW